MSDKVKIIDLKKILDARGNLTFIQSPDHISFKIERVFMTYDVPGGEIRGGHAYKSQEELIIALSGSFDVIIIEKDGSKKTYQLNRPYYGLYIPAKKWRHMENFSTNSLGLHLSSSKYDPIEYVRDFNEFLSII